MKGASTRSKTVIYVITKATWGGAQRYVWDMLVAAKNQGYTPLLVYGHKGTLSERAQADGIRTYPIDSLMRDVSLQNDFQALRDLYRIFSTFRPHVVHLNSSKAGALGALAAVLAGVPSIIFTAHGWAFTEPRSILSQKIFLLIHYITVLLSTHTIAVSDAVRSHTATWPFVQKKLHTIKNGIGSVNILSRDSARKKLIECDPSLSLSSLWIGTVAELHANKGLDVGIEAFRKKQLEHISWVVIGSGEKEEALRTQAKGVPTVHFIGAVADAELYMKAFDIFFLPSRTEALGYVLLEAGYAGVPLVGTNIGGIPEIIKDTETGFLVMNENPEDMYSILSKLAQDSSLRKKIGENARTYIHEHFSKETMCRETLSLYGPLA